jgi:dienelactone hydrolase
MRILEYLIAGILLMAVAARFFPGIKKRTGFPCLPVAAGLLIPVHLLVEGYRWQMVPIMVFAFGFMMISLARHYRPYGKSYQIRNKRTRVASQVFTFLLLLISILLPILLPVVNLPVPEGPYAVGVRSYRMTDYGREEIFTEDSLDHRSLLVTAWYPAEVDKGMTVSTYWDPEGRTGKVYSQSAGMGSFWYSHLSLVKTSSYPEAPVLQGEAPFPVIIYSPSFYGMNTENTMLMEELASKGYIVFSITHSYETIVSVFPDGEVVPGNLDHISELYDSHADQEDQLYEDYKNTEDIGRKTDIIKQILVVDDLFNQLVKIRREDAVFVLDEIEKLNVQEGIFHSLLDLNSVGILGWSFGGAAATEACIADERFKAGINMDGWPYGDLFSSAEPLSQAMMQIRSESEDEREDEQNDIISRLIFEKAESHVCRLEISGASHMNFWDFPLFFRIYERFGYWGPIDPLRLLEIEGVYITGFFDKHLKGKETDWQTSGRYREVNLTEN